MLLGWVGAWALGMLGAGGRRDWERSWVMGSWGFGEVFSPQLRRLIYRNLTTVQKTYDKGWLYYYAEIIRIQRNPMTIQNTTTQYRNPKNSQKSDDNTEILRQYKAAANSL